MTEEWFGRPFVHLKQPAGSPFCVGYACAMAARTSFDEWLSFVGDRPAPWADDMAVAFMASQGWHISTVGFKIDTPLGVKLGSGDAFRIEWRMAGNPALVSVCSRSWVGIEHQVYWDGYDIHDPDPSADSDGEWIGNYAVKGVAPMIWGGVTPIGISSAAWVFNPLDFQEPKIGTCATEHPPKPWPDWYREYIESTR